VGAGTGGTTLTGGTVAANNTAISEKWRIDEMDFSELVTARYSVREYRPKDVEEDKLNKVLEAARMSPTAANRQPFQLIVITTSGREDELGEIYPAEWFAKAPIVIAVCAVLSEGWVRKTDKVNYAIVDAAIVMDHITLAAANEGLGSCWIGAFDPRAAREVLGLPEGVEPVAFTPIGYAADSPREKLRRPLEKLVRYERW
jgi:nitroreductase